MRLAFSSARLPIVLALLTTAFVLLTTGGSAIAENASYNVKSGDTLLSIAIDLGVPDTRLSGWMDDVVQLNSLPSPDSLSVGQKLTLPSGSSSSSSGSTSSASSNTSSSGGGSYTVKPGDTLYDIASTTHVPEVAFAAWMDSVLQLNNLSNADSLKEGDTLRLPNITNTTSAAKPSLTPVNGGSINTSSTTNYTVLSGDTLHDIASKSGVGDSTFSAWVDAVLKLNNLSSPDVLQEGSSLKIPGKATGSSSIASSGTTSTVNYTVKSGDTLYDIAAKNGVTDGISGWVDNVLSLNSLASADLLREGDVLKIPGKASSASSPSSTTNGASNSAGASNTSTIAYTVKSGDTLYDIAAKNGITDGLGAWIDSVLSLNGLESADMLREGATIKVPGVPNRTATADTSSAPAPVPAASTPLASSTYTVKAGETFQGIARKLGVGEDVMTTWIDQVVMLSNIKKSDPLVDGEVLLVPAPPTPQAQASTLPSQTQSGDVKTPTSNNQKKPTTNYTVLSGDTLSDIAAKFKVAGNGLGEWVRDVLDLNRMDSPDFLKVGQSIVVPGQDPAPPKPATAVTAATATPPPAPSTAAASSLTRPATTPGVTRGANSTCFYSVVAGDTWVSIAQKLAVADASRAAWIDGISALNGIAPGGPPPVGDALRMLC